MDDLGDRMKMYEERGGCMDKVLPLLPVMVRLDGRAFHSFTRGLPRPYCVELMGVMDDTCSFMVQETNARIGYVQSDEITLILHSDDIKSQLPFDGRIQKMVSIFAAQASVRFNSLVRRHFSGPLVGKASADAVFDCRIWQVPSKDEAANALLWRERDATKNSIAMLAQSRFSHKELQGKTTSEMKIMLEGLNPPVIWGDYSAREKRGSFFRRTLVKTSPELWLVDQLNASGHPVPEFVERHIVKRMDMPPFGTVVNKINVIFHGEEPLTEEALFR